MIGTFLSDKWWRFSCNILNPILKLWQNCDKLFYINYYLFTKPKPNLSGTVVTLHVSIPTSDESEFDGRMLQASGDSPANIV